MTPTTRPWYYADDGQSRGPVPQAELEEMLLSGQLNRATLVWSHPMEDWAPATEVEALSQAVDPPPPPLSEEAKGPPPLEAEVEAAQRSYERDGQRRSEETATRSPEPGAESSEASVVEIEEIPAARQETKPEETRDTEPRPWRRYFAKMIDLSLFSVLAGLLYGLWAIVYDPDFAAMAILESGNAWLVMPLLALWIPVEAWMVATWHTTPGKWLTGLRVIRTSGQPWSYQDTLHRTASMIWRGLALGIPFANLVTMIVAYNKLSKDGVTTWDADHGFGVADIGMTPGRWGLLAVTATVCVWLWFS